MTGIPQDTPLELPVALVCTASVPVRIVQATVRRFDGARYDVELAPGSGGFDAEVVLDFSRDDLPLVRARVVAHDGDRLQLETLQARARDQREFPRMAAGIHLRYARVPEAVANEACEAWLSGGDAPAGADAWREPDPLMDFSASGFAFVDAQACAAGERLLLELHDPGGAGAWRSLGTVVRAAPTPAGDGRFETAVTLTGVPPEATQALLEYTVELQRHALGEADTPEDEGG